MKKFTCIKNVFEMDNVKLKLFQEKMKVIEKPDHRTLNRGGTAE